MVSETKLGTSFPAERTPRELLEEGSEELDKIETDENSGLIRQLEEMIPKGKYERIEVEGWEQTGLDEMWSEAASEILAATSREVDPERQRA